MFAPGGGRMAEAVRAFDWATTPLGPLETWPAELRTTAAMVLESRFAKALIWGPALTTLYNDAFAEILDGKPSPLGRSFGDIWQEVWHEVGPMVDKALAGKSCFFEDFALDMDRGAGIERAWFTFCFSPVRCADGTVAGMLDTAVETTEAVKARTTAEVLREELAHRLKNTMAMIQSLAQRTLSGVADRDAVKTFEKRMIALAHAHDVLGRGSWQNASLGELADGLLAMHGDRFDVSGPDVALSASATLRVSLILHELATNAVKYGALSAPDGRVGLHWHVEDGEIGEDLVVCWREAGGPAVTPPSRFGFGTRLIDLGMMGTGKVERRYPREGMQADLRVPLSDLQEH